MKLRLFLAAAASTALLAACADVADTEDLGGADDPPVFDTTGAKADGFALTPGSYDAHGVLRAANTLDHATLDDTVGLDRRAATNIVTTRDAEGEFKSVIALDEVPYVGRSAMDRLLAYAAGQGWVGRCGDGVVNGPEACDGGAACDDRCGVAVDEGPNGVFVHGVEEGSALALGVLAAAHDLTLEQLDDDARLDRRAAQGIVNGRPFQDLADLDGVPYVGAKAFGQLQTYAQANGLVPDVVDPEEPPVDEGPNTPAVHGVHEGSYASFGLLRAANTLDLSTLDHAVELDTRAAKNLYYFRLANGEYASLEALDAVPYVGASAFRKLLAYATAQGWLPSCGDRIVQPVEEACDGTAGCDDNCEETFRCGDGVVEDGEGCDDGNTDDADGCSAACAWEIARHNGGLGHVSANDVGPHRYVAGHFARRSGHQYWRLELDRPSRISVDIMAHSRNQAITYAEFLAGEVAGAPNQAGAWSIGEHGVENPWHRSVAFWRWYHDPNCGWNGCRRPDYDSVQKYTRLDEGDANQSGHDAVFEVPPGVYYIGFHTGAGNSNYTPALSYLAEIDVDPMGAVCGDGAVDADESCDDGNGVDGDGCSRRCAWETYAERENNDSRERANTLAAFRRVTGRINANDSDWYVVEVGGDGELSAQFAGCPFDGYLELYQGDELVAEDDDSAGDYCPLLDVDGLEPGYHFLRVRHAAADIDGGAYRLELDF